MPFPLPADPGVVYPRMGEAFFHPDGDRFVATESTRGPWSPDAQHAGPPAALLGRAVERFGGLDGVKVARVTYEILRPVPIGTLTLTTSLLRGGRSVEFVGAMLAAGGTEVMRATGVRVRTTEVPPGSAAEPAPDPPPPGPEHGEPSRFFGTGDDVGYHTAMEWRFVEGAFLDRGPATVWMRMRQPLLPDEEPSPLQRVLIAADSGNGVSAALDWRRWLFPNPDLTVYLHRHPNGEWVCLRARTTIEPSGLGLAESRIYDRTGPVARGLQSLFVARRP
jgi:Thioesterase-like superfamily